MDRERRRFFLVEGAEPGVVLRPRLAQPDVPLDHLDDVGLLLHGLGEVDHGACIEDKAGSLGGALAIRCLGEQLAKCTKLLILLHMLAMINRSVESKARLRNLCNGEK
jgi:hypothetical protein